MLVAKRADNFNSPSPPPQISELLLVEFKKNKEKKFVNWCLHKYSGHCINKLYAIDEWRLSMLIRSF